MLGVVPQLGRLFTNDEDRPDGPPVVILSDHLWRTHFQADPAVVSNSVALNGKLQTIVGVLPRSFSFPDLTLEPDVYSPIDLSRDTVVSIDKPIQDVRVIVLLRPGISIQQAELHTFYEARLPKAIREIAFYYKAIQATVEPLQRHIAGDSRKPLFSPRLRRRRALHRLRQCRRSAARPRRLPPSRDRTPRSTRRLTPALVRQFLVESLVLS